MLDHTDEKQSETLVSRRTVLGGLMAGAVTAAALGNPWSKADAAPSLAAPLLLSRQVAGDAIPRFQHAAALLPGGHLLMTGGRSGSENSPALAGSRILRLSDGTWLTAASMHVARAEHTAVALGDGRVLVMGGKSQSPLASAEIYDPLCDRWTLAAPMSQPRYGHTAVLVGGLVIVSGGFHRQALAGAEVYDVTTDRWQQLG